MWFLACAPPPSPSAEPAPVLARLRVPEDLWEEQDRVVADAALLSGFLAVEIKISNVSYSYAQLALVPLPLSGDVDPQDFVVPDLNFRRMSFQSSDQLLAIAETDGATGAGRISYWKAPFGPRAPDGVWVGEHAGSCSTECQTYIGGDVAGYSMQIGDFDQDGKEDLLIGAPGWDQDPSLRESWDSSWEGAVFLLSDPQAGTGTLGDAQRVLTGRLHGERGSRSFGRQLLRGDLDGDGRLELMLVDEEHPDGGRIFVFSGPAAGWKDEAGAVATWTGLPRYAGAMAVGTLDGQPTLVTALETELGLWHDLESGEPQEFRTFPVEEGGVADLLIDGPLWISTTTGSLPRPALYRSCPDDDSFSGALWESWSGYGAELLGRGELADAAGKELLLQDGPSLLVVGD